jgi:hypothetical protein
MAVKISKLWGDARFSSLSPEAKLLYIYLCTQPSISTLGVVYTHTNFLKKLTGDQIELGTLQIMKYLCFKFNSKSDIITILIKDHYKSIAKSKANLRKARNEYNNAYSELRELLDKHFDPSDFQDPEFTPPTPEQVTEEALKYGHFVNGQTFCDWYAQNNWYDKNDKRVRNWKSKLKRVWCKEDNKLQECKDAPKGFEFFYVELDNGDRVFPERWKDGVPMHKDFNIKQKLIQKYKLKDKI